MEQSGFLPVLKMHGAAKEQPPHGGRRLTIEDEKVGRSCSIGTLTGVMGFLSSCGRCRLIAGQEESQTQHLLAPALFFEMPCACFQ